MERAKPAQIVDAYAALLVESGVRQATIEAVARRAGLSKPGLLHHHGSRAELDAALVERLRALVREDLETMRRSEGGVAHYYLSTSLDSGAELERLVVAATRLAQAGSDIAGEALRWARELWFAELVDRLGDPALARLVMLAGDGMSYHTDIASPGEAPFVTEDDIRSIMALIDRMRS